MCPFIDLQEEAYNLMKARGSSVDAGIMPGRWMETCPVLCDIQYIELLTPIGPWKKGERALSSLIVLFAALLLSVVVIHHCSSSLLLSCCVNRGSLTGTVAIIFFAHDNIDDNPEETQRLQMVGTLMRQNMKVRVCPLPDVSCNSFWNYWYLFFR